MGPGNLTRINKGLLKIGITGIFGSGKTTVCSIFAREGIPVLSCDDIVHLLLGKKEYAEKIKDIFGKNILKRGIPDRKKLGKLIFSDKKKREDLEKLLHPAVFKELRIKILDYAKKNDIIVIEIPLLFETKSENLFNKIVVVTSPPEIIKKRLREKFKGEEVEDRWKSQIPLRLKEEKADYIIDNSGSYKKTLRQVKQLIKLFNTEITCKT
jgi:dephospho-CoA kinase